MCVCVIMFSPYLICRSPGKPTRVQDHCILDEEKVAVLGINVTVVLHIQTVTDRREDTVNKTHQKYLMPHPSTENLNESKAGSWLMTKAYRHDKNTKARD